MSRTNRIAGWSLSVSSLLISIGAFGAEPAVAPAPPPAAAPVPAAPKAATDAMPAVASPAPVSKNTTSPATPDSATGSGAARRPGSDRLNLDTTVVTGNRELPKVLYIVPWKRADLGDLPQQPFNSLLDEVLTPVDRDVFRREVTYFGAMNEADSARSGAPTGAAAGSEK